MKQKVSDKTLIAAICVLFVVALGLLGTCLQLAGERRQGPEKEQVESSQAPEGGSETSADKEMSGVREESALNEEDLLKIRQEAYAEHLIEAMSPEEKVGQMIMARYPSGEDGAAFAQDYHLGGYVFFAVDFEWYTAEEVIERNDALQAAADIPMLLSVDEEGGTVTRVSQYYRETAFDSPRNIYAEGGWEAIEADTREKCELLSALHLNMNLAPVADLSGDPYDFMYARSFGEDLSLVQEFVSRTVTIMKEMGIACSLKHFPGYGSNLDTHVGMAVDYRSEEEFYETDLQAFAAGIEAGAETIMVSHNIVTCFDAELPSSLSSRIHEIARNMGFDGVIITDDLAMSAIADYYGLEEAALLAVKAGNDMLITSNAAVQYDAILEAVHNGEIEESRLDESVKRILLMKMSMGILDVPTETDMY